MTDETHDKAEGTDEPEVRPFAQFLQEQREGVLHAELGEKLQELVKACSETSKSGSLQLTIQCAPTKNGVAFELTDKVKLNLPEYDRGASLFFKDRKGNLLRKDPNQQELPLREVSGGRPDISDLKEVK